MSSSVSAILVILRNQSLIEEMLVLPHSTGMHNLAAFIMGIAGDLK